MAAELFAMAFKSSMYNICYHYGETPRDWILANTYTGCILFADDELKHLATYLASESFQELQKANPQLHEYLLEKGFVVEENIDELKRVRIRFLQNKFTSRKLHLTIVPTNDCNLACPYCYESRNQETITPTIIEQVKQFVQIHAGSISVLGVTWYGGEPLLASWAVDELSRCLIELCESRKISYYGNMVTNGTLLTPQNIAMLKANKVGSIQVTIDGPEDIHNARRFYRDGHSSSFQDIIQGISLCKEQISVGIRINVDASNVERCWELVDYLSDKRLIGPGSGNTIALGIVKPWTNEVCSRQGNLLKLKEFEYYIDRFAHYLLDHGVIEELTHDFSPSTPCGAVNTGTYLICPSGDLKKCWIHPTLSGTEIGNLQQGIDFSSAAAIEWIGYDPTLRSNCACCALLPVCCGGCPYEQIGKPANHDNTFAFCDYQARYIKTNVLKAAHVASNTHL
jgi:uncharacterized protein